MKVAFGLRLRSGRISRASESDALRSSGPTKDDREDTCCFVPMSNSVLDRLKSNLFEFIHESMSEEVLERVLSEEVEFEGVKEL